jgi:hemerythrin-like domain-containing protein
MAAKAPRTSRPQRAAVPPLPPLETLDQTHRQMMQTLQTLKSLVGRLEEQGIDGVARSEAKQICNFFSGIARQHHADEETLVFPALVRTADEALIQHVLRLQQDHGWLEEDWLELAPQLQAVAEGYSWYELETLRAGVDVFVALYHDHIALEESLIYPEARRQLDAEAASRTQRLAGSGSN